MTTTPETLRAESAAHAAEAQASFDRCDTDGFMSQWASGITSAEKALAADVLENGGVWDFDCLVDEDGALVPARIIQTRYGSKWAIFASVEDANSTSAPIIAWAGLGDRALKNKGFRLATQTREARVVLTGDNAMSVRPIVIPADGVKFSTVAPVI